MAGGKKSTRRTATCHISFSIPRQARYFSNTARCLKVRSATVWQLLRDNTGLREGNGTDGFIQQHPTVPSHVSLERKKQASSKHRRHTQTLQCFSFLLLAFGNLLYFYAFLLTLTRPCKTFPSLQKAGVCFREKKKKKKEEKAVMFFTPCLLLLLQLPAVPPGPPHAVRALRSAGSADISEAPGAIPTAAAAPVGGGEPRRCSAVW